MALGPIAKKSKLKAANFGADVTFISLNHEDMNGAETTSRGEKESFVITGPGEYEVASIFATGLPTVSQYGGVERINTMYYFSFDGLNVLYAGALSDAKLSKSIIEEIDSVDVLFVPIGGDGVLAPADAQKLAVALEARVVVPIHWEGIGEKDALKIFLKEAGAESVKPVEKLTIKPKDVATLSGEVVVLKS